jgi:hypothetical protein
MNDYKSILLDMLGAINYTEDKEKFIAKFTNNIQLQSLKNLVQALSATKLKEIKNKLSSASNDQQKVSEILKSYFTEEQMQQALKNAAKDAVSNYITAINNTLSDTQRESLIYVLEKYGSLNLQLLTPDYSE